MARTKWFESRRAVAVLLMTVLWGGDIGAPKLQGQFRGLVVAGACAGGVVIGERLGAKVADYQAKRMKVPPEQAQKQKLAFRIGFALALCGGGAAIANTTYCRLSKRGIQARQKEVMNALDDATPMTPHSYTDPGATYEVHSASGFNNGVHAELLRELTPSDPNAAVNALARFAEEERRGKPFECAYPEAGLNLIARGCNIGARGWAKILVPYFQKALLRLDEAPNNAGMLDHWFRNSVPDNPYLRSAQLRADAARIQREGESGAQSVLMKIERESMLSAIDELRQLAGGGRLGPKADKAIDMLEAMYSQRITGTWALPPSLLKSMGYTLPFFSVGRQ